jgi:multiple sugar transport system ATP-binding protein
MIGSPAMNFFDRARVEGDGDQMKVVIDQVGQVAVPPLYRGLAKAAAGKHLTFGIRPENLQDAALRPPSAENGSVMTAPVEVVEQLGSELLVYLTAGGKSMTARLDPRSDAHTGGQMTLRVDNAHMHLFNSETGEAIFSLGCRWDHVMELRIRAGSRACLLGSFPPGGFIEKE